MSLIRVHQQLITQYRQRLLFQKCFKGDRPRDLLLVYFFGQSDARWQKVRFTYYIVTDVSICVSLFKWNRIYDQVK